MERPLTQRVSISTPTIKTDGVATVITDNLEVTFQNAEDETNFKEMVKDLKIENDPRMQLYLLNSMSFAGVNFMVNRLPFILRMY